MQPDGLFIRTLQAPDHLVKDERTGEFVISSQAFSPSSSDKTVSGDLGQLLEDDGLILLSLYPAVPRAVGAAALTVGEIRKTGADVEHSPIETDWYHGGITGIGSNKKKKRDLKDASRQIVAIDQAEAQRFADAKDVAARRIFDNQSL